MFTGKRKDHRHNDVTFGHTVGQLRLDRGNAAGKVCRMSGFARFETCLGS